MIAVLGCTKSKQAYACPTREMYSRSAFFQTELTIIRKIYGENWVVASSKYGIVKPGQIIEPYNTTLYHPSATVRTYLGADAVYLSKQDQRNAWGELIASDPVWQDHEVIDCWLSDIYWQNMQRKLRSSGTVRWIRPVVRGRGFGNAREAWKNMAEEIHNPEVTAANAIQHLVCKNLIYIHTVRGENQ